ncbi:hypothetical protein [Streptomyces sp. NPDC046887]|uniref:hypothetical protein n=1 Tax=Streptomyces sp. NPDC046887 TaxID=3155472 RepID=UPI0034059A4C
MTDLSHDPDEEALVERINAQKAAFAELDGEARVYEVSGPVRVTYGGEEFDVPLTVRDVRAALDAERRAAFEAEVSGAGPGTVGAVVRKWALEVIPGDELDRVDVLLQAERSATRTSEAGA